MSKLMSTKGKGEKGLIRILAVILAVIVLMGTAPTGFLNVYADETNASTVYVDGENGDDANDGSSANSAVKTISKAASLIDGKDAGIIYITSPVEVNENVALNFSGDVTIKRHEDNSAAMLNVNNGATLTLGKVTIDGNRDNVKSKASMIYVNAGGSLIINNGAILQNNEVNNEELALIESGVIGSVPDTVELKSGGAISCEKNSAVIMNGGTIQNNRSYNGGAVKVTGSFTMNDGIMQNNMAISKDADTFDGYKNGAKILRGVGSGGAVFLREGGIFTMNGGSINNNTAAYIGGAISVGNHETITIQGDTNKVYIHGGTISENRSGQRGGAIFFQILTYGQIDGSESNVYITNNVAAFNGAGVGFTGGGIYVNGENNNPQNNAVLNLENVYISENMSNWAGGGIASCPTSGLTISAKNGAVIAKNIGYYTRNEATRKERIFDIFITSADSGVHIGQPEVYLSSSFIGGGDANWMKFDHLNNDDAGVLYDGVNKAHVLILNDLEAYYSAASETDIQHGKNLCTVFITGNHAYNYGGGIASNGTLNIGFVPPVEISKTDIAGEELPGAEIVIMNAKGQEIQSWTSTDTPKTIKIPAGEYIFHEDAAPAGYDTVNDIRFAVDEDGNVTIIEINGEDVANAEGNKLTVVDFKPSDKEEKEVPISKTDLGGVELEGATITVTGGKDFTETWVSTEEAHVIKVLPGEYEMVEVAAPEGYQAITTTVKFRVDSEGKVTLITAEVNNGGEVEVQEGSHILLKDSPKPELLPGETEAVIEAKKVQEGKELSGNDYNFELVDAEGNVVARATNDKDGNIKFDAIRYSEEGTYEYTIREVQGNQDNIDYDKNEYKVTVTVKDVTPEAGESDENLTVSSEEVVIPDTASVSDEDSVDVEEAVAVGSTDDTADVYEDLDDLEEASMEDEEEIIETTEADEDATDIETEEVSDDDASNDEMIISGGEDEALEAEKAEETEAVSFDDEPEAHDELVISADATDETDQTVQTVLEATVEYQGGSVIFVNKYNETPEVPGTPGNDVPEKTPEIPEIPEIPGTPGEEKFPVYFSKTDLGGTELPGATIKLIDGDGNLVEEWTSTNDSHRLELTPGRYTMIETAAPDGFQTVTTEMVFIVDENGDVTLETTTVNNGGEIEVLDGNHVILKDAPEKTPDVPNTPGKPNTPNVPNTPGKPSAPAQQTKPAPKTGDASDFMPWVALIILAGTMTFAVVVRRKLSK